jgi:hypothetical protein
MNEQFTQIHGPPLPGLCRGPFRHSSATEDHLCLRSQGQDCTAQGEQGQHLHELECHVVQVGAGAVLCGALAREHGVGTPVQVWADDGELSGQNGEGGSSRLGVAA